MKKAICIVLTLAILFAFAACTKKDKTTDAPYEKTEPTTEEMSFIYPPINETSTTETTTLFVLTTIPTTAPTTKPTTAAIRETSKVATTAKKPTTTKPAATTADDDEAPATTAPEEYVTAKLPAAKPGAFSGTLSKEAATKLVEILKITNNVDSALSSKDYAKAQTELNAYAQNVKGAITKILADEELLAYVGEGNLGQWLSYTEKTLDGYAKFMDIVKETEGAEKKPDKFYIAYEYFQNAYTQALKMQSHIKVGADKALKEAQSAAQ